MGRATSGRDRNSAGSYFCPSRSLLVLFLPPVCPMCSNYGSTVYSLVNCKCTQFAVLLLASTLVLARFTYSDFCLPPFRSANPDPTRIPSWRLPNLRLCKCVLFWTLRTNNALPFGIFIRAQKSDFWGALRFVVSTSLSFALDATYTKRCVEASRALPKPRHHQTWVLAELLWKKKATLRAATANLRLWSIWTTINSEGFEGMENTFSSLFETWCGTKDALSQSNDCNKQNQKSSSRITKLRSWASLYRIQISN